MKTIEVICPVYNEGTGLRIFFDLLKTELNKLDSSKYNWNVLFVHDPGTDNTWQVIQELAAQNKNLRAISMWRRFGIQSALWAGLEASTGDIVIMMDADGQHPPALIHSLVAEHEKGHSLVLTKRIEGFRWKVVLFYKLMHMFSNCPPVESHSDFRLLDRKVVDTLLRQFKETKPFLRVLMGYWGNVPVIKFDVQKRLTGTSSFNGVRSYNYLVDVMLSAGHFPFRFVFPLLFLPFFVAGTTFLYFGKVFEAIVLLSLAFLGFSVGILSLHLETLIAHTRIRPAYLVREKLNVEE